MNLECKDIGGIDMAINEIRREIRMSIKGNQFNIGGEMDTDVECETVWMMPEEKLRLRSRKTQNGIDRPMREPAANQVF